MLATQSPFPQYFDTDGSPLDAGRLYFGQVGQNPETSPITVYWDVAGTQPAVQPLSTLNGYIYRNGAAALVFAATAYSLTVKDRQGRQLLYVPDSSKLANDQILLDAIAAVSARVDQFSNSANAAQGDALIAVLRQVTGAVATTEHDWHEAQVFDAKADFGVKADGATDDTAKMMAALAAAIAARPCTLRLPRGTIRTTASLGNLAYEGLRIIGAGLKETVIKCEHAGVAINIDAFASGLTADDATAPFVRMDMKDFTIEGNSATTKIVDAQGLARCDWDINARVANAAAGIAFHLKGVQLSELRLRCSTDLDTMSTIPREGLRMEAGTRDGVNVGNSSNNLLIGPRFTGLFVGMRLSGADQTTVLGGSAESNTSYGLLIATSSRYNTFIGTGFENATAANADVSDAGTSTKFLNIYTVKSIQLQGWSCELDGGFHERIEVQSGAQKNRVANVVINNWTTGSGGFFDAGTGTKYGDIYDADLAAYIYPQKSRVNIVVGASPFTWTNNTGQHVEVITQAGTVTQVRQIRDTDNWLRPASSPNSYLLAPTDAVEVSYSVAPTMSHVPFPGLEG